MSAIWGMIQKNQERIDSKVINQAKEFMGKYKIDRIEEKCSQTVYFACGHQYLTQEAVSDQLPYYDEEKGLFFTGDCIIDNREELIRELNLNRNDIISDGEIAYQAYLLWGERFVEHLLGVFSFAVYHEKDKRFLVYADHMGNRCINYYMDDDVILFSTTYNLFPKALLKDKCQLSEKWIAACEAETSACMIVFPGLTPYEGIFQVKAGHYVRIENNKVAEISYWNPIKIEEVNLPTENDYKELFVKIFTQCVSDILRPGVHFAATLSAGLDSNSVVSVAAPILENRGEVLHTYTSVPESDEDLGLDPYYLADESEVVKKTATFFQNMNCHFVDCKGESAFTHIKRFVGEYGFPLKSAVNLLWLDEVSKQARQEGCTMILSGQHGNSTISYGDIFSLAYQQCCSLHFLEAKKSVRDFLNVNHVYKSNFVKVLKAQSLEKICNLSGREKADADHSTYVKKELMNKYKVTKRRVQDLKYYGMGSMNSKKQQKRMPFNIAELQQLGLYNTMDSLINGIIERDPTRDKRLVELCISYPTSCFVSHGVERNMVRQYLQGIVPEHIRTDVRHRGMQGADFLKRINQTWEMNKPEVVSALKNPKIEYFFEQEKIDAIRKKCEETDVFVKEDGVDVIILLYLISLSYFLMDCEYVLE